MGPHYDTWPADLARTAIPNPDYNVRVSVRSQFPSAFSQSPDIGEPPGLYRLEAEQIDGA